MQLFWRQLSAACWSEAFVQRHCVFVLEGQGQHVVEERVGAEEGKDVQVTTVRSRCLADTVEDTLRDVLSLHTCKGGDEESQGGNE